MISFTDATPTPRKSKIVYFKITGFPPVSIAVCLALLLSFSGPMQQASAEETDILSHSYTSPNSETPIADPITRIDENTISIDSPEGTYTATFDKSTGMSRVVTPNGEVQEFSLQATNPISDGPVVTPLFDWSGVPCSMILWTVDAIHAGGWAAAASILALQGAAGAAILAAVYGLGTSGFLALVGTQC